MDNVKQNDVEKKEKRTMTVVVVILVAIVASTFILAMFEKPYATSGSNNYTEQVYDDILSVMAMNGVLENENSSMLIAYSDMSYLEMLHSVYDMSTCTYRISEGDTEGEYIVNYTGNGRDNPFSGYIGNYRMSIVVDLNDSHCYYSYDGNTYVSYIIMSQN